MPGVPNKQPSRLQQDISEISGLPFDSQEFKETYGRILGTNWQIGRRPQSDADWLAEYAATANSLFSVLDSGVTNTKNFEIGKAPVTPEELDAEIRLRDSKNRWEVELEDRKHRANLEAATHDHKVKLDSNQSTLIRKSESIRGWALVAVVVTIVVSPWVAIFSDVTPGDFGLYMIPVTGIAGTIIGYWFGQGGRTTAPSISGAGGAGNASD